MGGISLKGGEIKDHRELIAGGKCATPGKARTSSRQRMATVIAAIL